MINVDNEKFRESFEYIVGTTAKVSDDILVRLHNENEINDDFIDIYQEFTKCMEHVCNYLRLVKVSVDSKSDLESCLENMKNDFPS